MDNLPARHPDPDIERAVRLSRLLDNGFLDPLVGLVAPGVGDVVSAVAGVYIVSVAIRKGVPAVVVARMLLNLALDALVGAVPVLGDLFDFVFRANRKNVELLTARYATRASTAGDWLRVVGALAALAVALMVPLLLVAWTVGTFLR